MRQTVIATYCLGLLSLILTIFCLFIANNGVYGDCVQSGGGRRPASSNHRNRNTERISFLKDAFYEDYSFVVRIRTSYNQTTSITCNAVLLESQLVLSDVTCIKYQGMANIDAKYVQVLAGEANNESVHEVEQIYINKADPKDPGTELAILRLSKPLLLDSECKTLIRPEKNHSIENDAKVRVVGYTQNNELKESRSKVSKSSRSNKYICTSTTDLNGSAGCQLLKGAPLIQMTECNQFQLVGILSRVELVTDAAPTIPKRHQDCYVLVSSQMRWFEQVKSLTALAAKNAANSANEHNVIVVSVDDAS